MQLTWRYTTSHTTVYTSMCLSVVNIHMCLNAANEVCNRRQKKKKQQQQAAIPVTTLYGTHMIVSYVRSQQLQIYTLSSPYISLPIQISPLFTNPQM